MSNESKCPVMHGSNPAKAAGSLANQHWWPNQLSLRMLRQNSAKSDPMDEDFDYRSEVASLDFVHNGVPEGGWFPLLIGFIVSLLLLITIYPMP